MPWDTGAPQSFHGQNRMNAAALFGYENKTYFGAAHVCHPMITEIVEEAYRARTPDFAWNAAFKFRDRDQFWSVSAHDHVALSSARAVVFDRPQEDWQHFSVRFCREGTPQALRRKLKIIAGHKVALTCLNYLESVIAKVPDTMAYIDRATGPAQSFERT